MHIEFTLHNHLYGTVEFFALKRTKREYLTRWEFVEKVETCEDQLKSNVYKLNFKVQNSNIFPSSEPTYSY